jgi:hypothetical protein
LARTKSHGKNILSAFSDVFDVPESESEVSLASKNLDHAILKLSTLIVRNCRRHLMTSPDRRLPPGPVAPLQRCPSRSLGDKRTPTAALPPRSRLQAQRDLDWRTIFTDVDADSEAASALALSAP